MASSQQARLAEFATPPGEMIKIFPSQIRNLIFEIASRTKETDTQSIDSVRNLTVGEVLDYYQCHDNCLYGFKIK